MAGKGKPILVGKPHDESLSLEEQENLAKESQDESDGNQVSPPEQADKPATPKAVRNGHMLVEFIRVKLDKEKDSRLLGLEISFPLTAEHKGLLPEEVESAWKYMDKHNNPLIRGAFNRHGTG